MVYITRRESFNAAHKLFLKELTDEENYAMFGKCSSPNWHGHNYILFVTVKGEIDTKTGFVVDLKTLSQLIKVQVIDKLDHKNLNIDVDFLQNVIPTTENLAVSIWNVLFSVLKEKNILLHSIKIEETENNFVEYYGI